MIATSLCWWSANLSRSGRQSGSKQHDCIQVVHENLLEFDDTIGNRLETDEQRRRTQVDAPPDGDVNDQLEPSLESEIAPIRRELPFHGKGDRHIVRVDQLERTCPNPLLRLDSLIATLLRFAVKHFSISGGFRIAS